MRGAVLLVIRRALVITGRFFDTASFGRGKSGRASGTQRNSAVEITHSRCVMGRGSLCHTNSLLFPSSRMMRVFSQLVFVEGGARDS